MYLVVKINLDNEGRNPLVKLNICLVYLFLTFTDSLEFFSKNINNDLNPPSFDWIPDF